MRICSKIREIGYTDDAIRDINALQELVNKNLRKINLNNQDLNCPNATIAKQTEQVSNIETDDDSLRNAYSNTLYCH